MNNAKLTRKFTEEFANEIDALIKDLNLENVDIRIRRAKPEDPETEYEVMCDKHLRYRIFFNWDNILKGAEEALPFGLVVLAEALRIIWYMEGMGHKVEAAGYGDNNATVQASKCCPVCDISLYALQAADPLLGLPRDET